MSQEYDLYLRARYDQAEAACKGVMFNQQYCNTGALSEWKVFRLCTTKKHHGISDELDRWFDEHGLNLTYTAYARQRKDKRA